MTNGPGNVVAISGMGNNMMTHYYEVPKVSYIVDATGAGDAFVGGYISSMV